jgi:hypothetical protein
MDLAKKKKKCLAWTISGLVSSRVVTLKKIKIKITLPNSQPQKWQMGRIAGLKRL